MTTALQLTVARTDGNKPTLVVTGEIDASNAATFGDALADAVDDAEHVTVDLTAVDYLDSAALALLFAHVDQIDIRISTLHETLLTVCGLTDLTDVQIVPS